MNGKPAIPPFRMGQYGLTLGGPIKKDKLFFFISYEGLRQLQSTNPEFSVPVACARVQQYRKQWERTPGSSHQQDVLNTSPQTAHYHAGISLAGPSRHY